MSMSASLSLNLPPVAYVASEATKAVALQIVKLAGYKSVLDLGTRFGHSLQR